MIEQGKETFGAYVPDLPGCAAVGETEAQVRRVVREAVAFHLEALAEDGRPLPRPRTHVAYVDLAA